MPDESLAPRARKNAKRCEELARKGTGTGTCDRPLDAHGQCDRAGEHMGTNSARKDSAQ